ncbi:MFS transporter [Roseomonas sp. HJA6]|uniref:MFS transporter n=1 Tax=Roseomonas alba TaxID=2846776 RepID=A0ABS7A9T6_9PROT|nr:MFS transporter [Neoroseomonas alba]
MTTEETALRDAFLRAFPGVSLVIFLAAVDQTIVATALPAIAAEMGGIERTSWILVAYLVAATCAAPVFGQLGDCFGRRRVLFGALAVFFTGCLGCVLAPTLPALVVARIVQGFGGGALLTLAQALIGEALPPRDRGRYQARIAGSYAFASAFGPVAGGYMTQAFGWRSVFLLLLPIALACAALARRLPYVQPARLGIRLRFDWTGLALFVVMVAAALIGLDRARRLDPALLPLAGGLAALALGAGTLLLRAERAALDPLLPLSVFSEPSIWRCYAMSAAVVGAQVGMISFLPVWLQTVRGLEPGPSGLMLLAMSAGGVTGAFFTGRMAARTGHAILWPSIFLPLGSVVWAGLAIFAPVLPLVVFAPLLMVTSFCSGCSFPAVQVTAQMAAGRERLGAVSAGIAFSRNIGAATGTALVAAVVFAALTLTGPATTPAFQRLVAEGPGFVAAMGPEAAAVLRADLVEAFRMLFVTVALLMGLGAFFAWRVPLRRV